MDDVSGLAPEQAVIDVLYARLDELRGEAERRLAAVRREGPSGSPQNRSERDAFATLYADRIATLDAVEDRLCFGRIDTASERHYIGRIGLSDPDHVPLLTDWRAKAAAPFYSATAQDPQGILSRRHITTTGRQVTAVEDDVLDVDALRSSGRGGDLSGEGALLASLSARRTGHMTDIVATIQAEQDAVIRAPLAGALVVQGGPGTGKTAVALHRAAFLLYHHRERLKSSGVLLIGPSARFLKYIDRVLPSLGETGAVSTTVAGLVPDVEVVARESDEIAAVKGRESMAEVIRRAVRERQRLPREEQEIQLDGHRIAIRPSDIAQAQAHARREGTPHNIARAVFVKHMVRRLAAQVETELGETLDEADRHDIERDIRDNREVRIALNLAWLPLTPEQLLRDLLSQPHLLEHAAAPLSPSDRALLSRRPEAPFTDADVPLLDEAYQLLGELPGTDPRRVGPSSEEVDYARGVLEIFGNALVTPDLLAERMAVRRTRWTVAEHAARDRTWTFGHVVVDEAQDLTAMAWRMLLRRCPSRSFTIVGDVAQSTRAPSPWKDTLEPLFGDALTERTLTVGYRIPKSVSDLAQSFAMAAGLPVSPLEAVRDVDEAVCLTETSDPIGTAQAIARSHTERLASQGGGLVALLVPERWISLALGSVAEVADIAVLSPRDAKGLEFDVVVLVEPREMAERPGDLYVALTRPTNVLEVVYREELPIGFPNARDNPGTDI